MKHLFYLLLTVFFVLTLAACSQQKTETQEPKTEEEQDLQPVSWSYTGEAGPQSWGELDEEYAACVNGSEQSPINIDFSQAKIGETLVNIDTHYEPASFSFVNDGHTIQVNNSSKKNKMILEETEYRLIQFHFHTPSEHQFNGIQYPMELHLVHQNGKDELAVLGVRIQEGNVNENLQPIWDVLPKEKTEEEVAVNESINLQPLLPQTKSFVHYEGSLTTPPCTEDVKWFVLEQPIDMSKEQIEAFRQIFPDNHRPVQPINEREIMKN